MIYTLKNLPLNRTIQKIASVNIDGKEYKPKTGYLACCSIDREGKKQQP